MQGKKLQELIRIGGFRTQSKNRSELTQITNILEILSESGGKVSSGISREANLSYDVLVDKLTKLHNAGMVVFKEEEKRLVKITESGIIFLRETNKFKLFVEQMGLKIRL